MGSGVTPELPISVLIQVLIIRTMGLLSNLQSECLCAPLEGVTEMENILLQLVMLMSFLMTWELTPFDIHEGAT